MLCCSDLKLHVHSGNLFVQQCRGRRLSLQLFMRCYCAAPPNTLFPFCSLSFLGHQRHCWFFWYYSVESTRWLEKLEICQSQVLAHADVYTSQSILVDAHTTSTWHCWFSNTSQKEKMDMWISSYINCLGDPRIQLQICFKGKKVYEATTRFRST